MDGIDWTVMSAEEAEDLAAYCYRLERKLKRLVRKAAWAAIDWVNVKPLEADEKCVDENPAYLSIPF